MLVHSITGTTQTIYLALLLVLDDDDDDGKDDDYLTKFQFGTLQKEKKKKM
jgi:hypothetical protein